MKTQVYKVITCRNNGEDSFYIKIESSGEFADLEFNHEEFSFNDDTYISPKLSMMLANGLCVLQLEKVENPGDKILSTISDEMTFKMEDIKQFSSCEECNKLGVKLVLPDGTELYPSESLTEFEGLEGTYVKIKYEGKTFCAYVDSYKYNTKEHTEEITFISGCYKNISDCTADEKKYKEVCSGRDVEPDILTKPLSKC